MMTIFKIAIDKKKDVESDMKWEGSYRSLETIREKETLLRFCIY